MQGSNGSTEDQFFLCTCKRYIKYPQLLSEAFHQERSPYDLPAKGWSDDPLFRQDRISSDPQLRMDQDTGIHIPEIKAFSHSCCKHYRKLQSLALMDRHDLYRTFPCSGKIYLPVIHLILLKLLDISYKIKKPPIACLLIFHCFFHKHVQVCISLFTIWHCLCMVSISGTRKYLQDQLMNRCVGCLITKCIHSVHKTGQLLSEDFFIFLKAPMRSVVLHKSAHTFIDHSFRICDPKLSQLFCGTSHDR